MSRHILPFSLDNRIRVQHLTLGEFIQEEPESKLKEEVHAGKWTAYENAAHLAAFHAIFAQRIDRMLKEQNPVFDPYVWQEDPLFAAFKTMTKEELLQRYESDRNALLTLVDSISEEDMQRKGIHLVYGEFTIAQWLEFFVLHESHHLFVIYKLIHFQKK